MRKILVALTFCGLMTGCSPTWFQDFKTDPVKQTDIVLNSAASIERIANVVFGQLVPMLPADKQAIFQAKFDGSVVALNKAMDAVRSAVKAAANAQVENPDLSKVIADVLAAVNDIKSVVEEVRGLLKTPPVAAAPGAVTAAPVLTQDPVGYNELGSMVEGIK
jgi:hypothetical protein